jgi:hypothetical protein
MLPHSESLLTSHMDRPLPNSYWVIPGRMLAGEYPGGTDFTDSRARLAQVRDAGIDYFVDLTEEGELPAYRHLLPFHIKYLRCAIADHGVPNDGAQVQKLLHGISVGPKHLRALSGRYRPYRPRHGLLSGGGRRGWQSSDQTSEPAMAAKRARQELAQSAADGGAGRLYSALAEARKANRSRLDSDTLTS